MCGLFGLLSSEPVESDDLKFLVKQSEQRGRDSSGVVFLKEDQYDIHRADFNINKLLGKLGTLNTNVIMGHSRLITNGLSDNQPVVEEDVCVLHNGIIVNEDEAWAKAGLTRKLSIDSEIIVAIANNHIKNKGDFGTIKDAVLSVCKGVIACALVFPKYGKVVLFSNNGSLYVGKKGKATYYASEFYPLSALGCEKIVQVKDDSYIIDIPVSKKSFAVKDEAGRSMNLIPTLILNNEEEALLLFPENKLKRCSKCVLPETMPFIYFDQQGICNYCKNYKVRNREKPKSELFNLVEPYRRSVGNDCIVPFSGGRDSCYALHLIVKELKMKPIAYTYDWGMVTDLGRRNISRMCAELGVENIIVAADIHKKRENIAKNLKAWLKSPHLGMISLLTAGDKHFFRYVETVKEQTGIKLNLWGVNPLEVTHFKTGFLGIKPDFEEKMVYSNGTLKQLKYHFKRFSVMTESPGYFNSSLWDTLSGEYYRSFTKKKDYFHIFDYWKWDEKQIDDVLASYDWERAIDTTTTWRIGDGTASFYNYVYYTVAGFSEHDTFRSNQIREGEITREEALRLVEEENRPRYSNIRWYLDALGMDFKEVIRIVNSIPRLY
ncbi:MAG: glucosamine 6-phosphate synthetase [Bdellovibrio sp.]|nr:glucosamine 6-phosphate synthetase [Bdellovibrio sp.]